MLTGRLEGTIMQILCNICIYVSVLAAGIPADTNRTILGHAALTRDVFVPNRSEAALPVVRPGEEYNCIAVDHYGYLLTCRDADDAPRVALLKFSDPWGHATAKCWAHHAPMEDNTIVIKTTSSLLPADLPLREGERHPIVKMGQKDYTIRYSFRDFEVDATLARADAEYEPPPPPEAREPEKTAADGTQPTVAPAQDDAAAAPQPDQAPAVDVVPFDPLDEPPPPPVDAVTMEPAPAEPAPAEPAPVEPAPAAPAQAEPAPAEDAPAEQAPDEPAPAEQPPAEPAPAEPAPAEAAPAAPPPLAPAAEPPAVAEPEPAAELPVEVALAQPAQEPQVAVQPVAELPAPAAEGTVQPEPAVAQPAPPAPAPFDPAQIEGGGDVIVPLNQPGRITIEWWGDKARPYIGDDGFLHVEVDPAKHKKTFVTILLGKAHQIQLGDLFSVDIDNSAGAAAQTALALMPRGEYHESMAMPLKTGSQTVVIDLADETFKTEKTGWMNTTALPLPSLASRLTVVIYTRRAGEVVLSNLRFMAALPVPE